MAAGDAADHDIDIQIKSFGGFKFERKHHLTTLERMVRWQESAYD